MVVFVNLVEALSDVVFVRVEPDSGVDDLHLDQVWVHRLFAQIARHQCGPVDDVPPMYIPGLRLIGSSPLRTMIDLEVYSSRVEFPGPLAV